MRKGARNWLWLSTVIVSVLFFLGCVQPFVMVPLPPPPSGPPPGLRTAAINHIRNAKRQLAKRHCRQAVKQLNKAIDKDPANPNGYYWMGVAQHQCGFHPRAVEFWRTAITIRVGDRHWESRVRTAIGFSLELSGRYGEAAGEYRLALQLNPNNVVAKIGFGDAQRHNYQVIEPRPRGRKKGRRGRPAGVRNHSEKLRFIMRGVVD